MIFFLVKRDVLGDATTYEYVDDAGAAVGGGGGGGQQAASDQFADFEDDYDAFARKVNET